MPDCPDPKDVVSNAQLSKDLAELSCEVSKLRDAIYGHDTTIGLLARLASLETAMADIKRLLYYVLTALIGAGILMVLNLILQHGPTITP